MLFVLPKGDIVVVILVMMEEGVLSRKEAAHIQLYSWTCRNPCYDGRGCFIRGAGLYNAK